MPVYSGKEYEMPVWASCNFEGNDILPADRRIIETFAIWLKMDDDERVDAIRLDPEWRKFVLGRTELVRTITDGINPVGL
jgi:hypothetical protein